MSNSLELSNQAFERLQELVRRTTAIELTESKRQLVYSRFVRRVHALGLTTFDDYCDLIDEGDSQELAQFTSAITTNFSSFFRENHHFDFLTEYLTKRVDKRLRIWSAGCATGEEPYSIAMTVLAALPDVDDWDIKILATDVDTAALAEARAGVYADQRAANISEALKRRWLQRGKGVFDNHVRIGDEVRKLICFRELNLIRSWPMHGPFDIIFCRNVVIYFGNDAKRELFHRFAGLQQSGSPLIIGHSENLANFSTHYDALGKTIYQRNDRP